MRVKKIGCLAAAAMLVLAMLVTNCADSPNFSQEFDNYKPPEGMGYVRLIIKDPPARTIMPTPDYPTAYELSLSGANSGTYNNYTSGSIITLPNAGLTDITVLGYSTYVAPADPGNVLVASGTGSVTIVLNTGNSTSVTLSEIVNGTGTGTFSWDISSVNTDLETFTMTITQLGAGAVTPAKSVYDFLGADSGALDSSATLNSGYYNVVFNLAKDGTVPLTLREILHVYEGMDSEYTREFAALKGHTVTFNHNNSSYSGPTTLNALHNGFVREPADPEYDADDSRTFLGWFSAATGGAEFEFEDKGGGDMRSADPIIGNITVHAQWGFIATFDHNNSGGLDDGPTHVKADKDGFVAEPPTPAYDSEDTRTFLGWFTATTGGTEFEFTGGISDIAITADTTYYAQWAAATTLTVTITTIYSDDESPEISWTPASGPYTFSSIITFTVDNAQDYESVFTWEVDGIIDSEDSDEFIFDLSTYPPYSGKYQINIKAITDPGGKTVNKVIEIEITAP